MSADPKSAPPTAAHYAQGDLLEKIIGGVEKLGKTPASVTIEDLGPVDEFHIGGRVATQHLLDKLNIAPDALVIDIGCGIGGTARLIASQADAAVHGVDLTAEYVSVGNTLNEWVGLSDQITLSELDALDLPFDAGSFNAATMLHVGMNISDKAALFAGIFRVLEPGGVFGLYDIMKLSDKAFDFPVPWAGQASISFVEPVEAYEQALQAAGFQIVSIENRAEFATGFLTKLKAMIASVNWPPPLGLHLIMGAQAPDKLGNMARAVFDGALAPVQIVVRKPR